MGFYKPEICIRTIVLAGLLTNTKRNRSAKRINSEKKTEINESFDNEA
jgi:hypothetical protein